MRKAPSLLSLSVDRWSSCGCGTTMSFRWSAPCRWGADSTHTHSVMSGKGDRRAQRRYNPHYLITFNCPPPAHPTLSDMSSSRYRSGWTIRISCCSGWVLNSHMAKTRSSSRVLVPVRKAFWETNTKSRSMMLMFPRLFFSTLCTLFVS